MPPSKIEKKAIARVFADLIKADRIVDTAEMEFWDKICREFAITPEIHSSAKSISLAAALEQLAKSDRSLRESIVDKCRLMTLSDGICAHSEALVLSAIILMLSPDGETECSVLSIPRADFNIDVASVVYVEAYEDRSVNNAIRENYRAIFKEFQLAGFHFLYLPNIIDHYRDTEPEMFRKILRFLAPNLSEPFLDRIYGKIMAMTTSSFTRDILCNKCGIESLRTTDPALLIKISNSFKDDVEYANYLKIEVDKNILSDIYRFVDGFTDMLSSDTFVVKTSEERDNQFHFFGFYKQLLEIFLIPKGIRSEIEIDPVGGKITFSGINTELTVPLGERVLYAFFLCQGDEGINLLSTDPAHAANLERYNERYEEVYHMMGGHADNSLDLSVRQRRSPMITHINNAVRSLPGLYHPKDYTILENPKLHFFVHIDPSLIFVKEKFPRERIPLLDSEFYRRVMEI